MTVHDLAWRRHPEATTPRGAALARGRAAPGSATAARARRALPAGGGGPGGVGVDAARITVVPGGADHLPDPDPAPPTPCCAGVGVSRRVPPHRGHARAAQERGPAGPGLRPGAALAARAAGPWWSWGRRAGARALAVGPTTDGVVFTGARPRPRAGRALPAGPGLRLRAADRGLRAAAARGHADRHAARGRPTRCPSVHDLGDTGPRRPASSTRSTSTTSRPASSPS